MKRRTDPRHLKRREVVRVLFSWSFQKRRLKNALVKAVIENLTKVDKIIAACASEWPIEKIAKVDLAILRLSVYELMIAKTQPPKVVIDEAVELAKEFGGEKSPSFVNGVLGTAIKERS